MLFGCNCQLVEHPTVGKDSSIDPQFSNLRSALLNKGSISDMSLNVIEITVICNSHLWLLGMPHPFGCLICTVAYWKAEDKLLNSAACLVVDRNHKLIEHPLKQCLLHA